MKNIFFPISIFCAVLTFGTTFDTNLTESWQKQAINKSIIYTIKGKLNSMYTIQLVQGDILTLCDTIKPGARTLYTVVNAANKFLQLGGGIAGVIKNADKSGNIQKECDDLLETHGNQNQKQVPVGTCWLTTSGSLKEKYSIKAIIHAVGPDCRIKQEKSRVEDLLRMAYNNIFAVSINHNKQNAINEDSINTVACPSLSTGIFSCDLQKAAIVAAETIFSIMYTIAQNNNPHAPTTFVMVAYDNRNFEAYKKAFNEVAEKKQKSYFERL